MKLNRPFPYKIISIIMKIFKNPEVNPHATTAAATPIEEPTSAAIMAIEKLSIPKRETFSNLRGKVKTAFRLS